MKPKGIYVTGLQPAVHDGPKPGRKPRRSAGQRKESKKKGRIA